MGGQLASDRETGSDWSIVRTAREVTLRPDTASARDTAGRRMG